MIRPPPEYASPHVEIRSSEISRPKFFLIYILTVRRANFWLFPLNAKLSNVYGRLTSWDTRQYLTLHCFVLWPRHGYHICSRTDLHRPSWSHRQLEVQHPLAPYSWDRWSSSSASRRCTPRGRCACRVGSALHHRQWTLSCRSHTLCSFYSHRKCQLVGVVLIQFSGLFWPVLLQLVDWLVGTHLGTDNILELRYSPVHMLGAVPTVLHYY